MLFNLIIRADETLPMLTSRMFERTPDELADRYRTSTSFDFNALAQLPTVMRVNLSRTIWAPWPGWAIWTLRR